MSGNIQKPAVHSLMSTKSFVMQADLRHRILVGHRMLAEPLYHRHVCQPVCARLPDAGSPYWVCLLSGCPSRKKVEVFLSFWVRFKSHQTGVPSNKDTAILGVVWVWPLNSCCPAMHMPAAFLRDGVYKGMGSWSCANQTVCRS